MENFTDIGKKNYKKSIGGAKSPQGSMNTSTSRTSSLPTTILPQQPKYPPPTEAVPLTPPESLPLDDKSTVEKPKSLKLRRLPPPPLSSALTPAQQLAEREREKKTREFSLELPPSPLTQPPPPPNPGDLPTQIEMIKREERLKKLSTKKNSDLSPDSSLDSFTDAPPDSFSDSYSDSYSDKTLHQSELATKKARNTDFFNEGLTPLQKASNVKFESEKGSKQSLKSLDPSANPFVPNLFIPKSPQEPVPPRSSSKRFQTSKKSKEQSKTVKRKTARQIQKELDEKQERIEQIHMENFQKKTIIKGTNKFRSLLSVDSQDINEDDALIESFNSVKINKSSLELQKIVLPEIEKCTPELCKLWSDNTYFNMISSKEANQPKFEDGNIIFKLKISGKFRSIKIPRYTELNEYLKNIKILINRINLVDSNCDTFNKLDQIIETLYRTLHKIYSSDVNKLNINDDIMQQLTTLYIARKAVFNQENKDEWNSISSRYKELQSQLHSDVKTAPFYIEPPILSINNKLYVILTNPQIID